MIRLLFLSLTLLVSLSANAQRDPSTRQAPTTAPKATADLDKVIVKTQKKRGDYIQDSLYHVRVQESELDGMYIPKDLYDAFRELDKLMDDYAKEAFMAFSDEEVDGRTHGTLGGLVRK